jgi:ATP-dependent Clp protease ATP-binding subunit ClpA
MHELSLKLKDKKVSIKTTKDARELIAKQGFDANNGARPLSRVIQEYIKKPLSEELLFGNLTKGGDVTVGVKDGKIVIITDKEQA